MTPTGKELYNSCEFWKNRLTEIFSYITLLHVRHKKNQISKERFDEVLNSSLEIGSIIIERIMLLDEI